MSKRKGRILDDLNNGNPNGQGYSIKEILTEHVRMQQEFENRLVEVLEQKQDKHECDNQFFLIRQSISKNVGFLFILISALAGYVFYG